MTIDKKEVITLPKWLVILVLPGLVSALVAYGAWSSWKGSTDTESQRNKQDIQKLYDQKADRSENTLIMNSLERIEKKLDDHIDKNN